MYILEPQLLVPAALKKMAQTQKCFKRVRAALRIKRLDLMRPPGEVGNAACGECPLGLQYWGYKGAKINENNIFQVSSYRPEAQRLPGS